jgi:integrase
MSDATTYDVRIWAVERRKRSTVTTYRVRWLVDGERFGETFATRKLADSHRAALLAATRGGEQFSTATGLPRSWTSIVASRTWVEVAREYMDAIWRDAAPRHRKSTAEGLVTLSCALVRDGSAPPNAKTLRVALMRWEFNTAARARDTAAPAEYDEALRWIADNSVPISNLATRDGVRGAVDAISVKLDGEPAAHATVSRKRAALSGALNHAVEKGYLEQHMLRQLKTRRKRSAAQAIDPRVVVNPDQARALLFAAHEIDPTVHAFFAAMYYAGLRTAEARDLREANLDLPEADGWGRLVLRGSYQESGEAWTDNGKRGEERELKHRTETDVRKPPAHPELVKALRAHVDTYGSGVDGRLFVTRVGRGGRAGVPLVPPYQNPVSMGRVYKVWKQAREAALTVEQVDSPLAREPYDLRHACVSTWLSSGVDATQVAEWAGHSVAVLQQVYASCLDDQEDRALRLIEQRMNPGG